MTLEKLRLRLAAMEALPQLAALGLLSGVGAGALIIAFRLLIESAQASYLAGGQPENYEALPMLWRLALPTAGGLIVGIPLQFGARQAQQVGVVHVMERLAYHQGHLRWRNTVTQFLGAALSIAGGHSVGREESSPQSIFRPRCKRHWRR